MVDQIPGCDRNTQTVAVVGRRRSATPSPARAEDLGAARATASGDAARPTRGCRRALAGGTEEKSLAHPQVDHDNARAASEVTRQNGLIQSWVRIKQAVLGGDQA